MSGICGIVNFDGSPVEQEALQKMTEAAAYRGSDGIHYWIGNNVGFAHLAFHTTPESVRETQPLTNRRGDIVVTADARVDNRDELVRILTAKGYLRNNEPTDVDLILVAYECWGEECPKHIIGDFAFAIWDESSQTLICARDPIGIRSLFYCWQGRTLYFATAIASILAVLGSTPSFNDCLLLDYLSWRFNRWTHETVYQTVSRIPAGHSYSVKCGKERLNRYWMLGCQSPPRYKSDEEYFSHFREVFRAAICRRLRSTTPIGISLSGGLDSSSIAGMTNQIYQTVGFHQKPEVHFYAYAYEGTASADEREYLEAVLEQCQQFPATIIDEERVWGLKDISIFDKRIFLDEPELLPMSQMLIELLGEARQHGCRVLLTGGGGDQVMSSGAYFNPLLIFDVGLQQLGAELKHFWRHNRWSMLKSLPSLFASIVKPLIPTNLTRRRRIAQLTRSIPAWVNRKHLMSCSYTESVPPASEVQKLPSRSATTTFRQLTGGWYAALLSYLDALSSQVNVEYRLPYLDRELVDFMLVIPARFRFSNGYTKVMLRKALTGVLAEDVRQRTKVTHFSYVVSQGLREKERPQIESLLNDVPIYQSKYLEDTSKLLSAWKVYYENDSLPSFDILAPLLLQRWFRSVNRDNED